MSRSHELLNFVEGTGDQTSGVINPMFLHDKQGIYQATVTEGDATTVIIQGRISNSHEWADLATSGGVGEGTSVAGVVGLLPQVRAFFDNAGSRATAVVSLME